MFLVRNTIIYSIPPTYYIVRGQLSYSISGNIQYAGDYHTLSYSYKWPHVQDTSFWIAGNVAIVYSTLLSQMEMYYFCEILIVCLSVGRRISASLRSSR